MTHKGLVLAYSGGEGSTAALASLAAQDGHLVTVTLDDGEVGRADGIRHHALSVGASRSHVIDMRDEFAIGYLLPAIQAHALGAQAGRATAALRHALVARTLVDVARMENVGAVAHGARAAADHARLDHLLRSLDANVALVPVNAVPRARAHVNGRRHVRRSATGIAHVDIRFEQGVPISINAIPMPLAELIESLATIAQTPAIEVLQAAHLALERHVTSAALAALKKDLAGQYSAILLAGDWFSSRRQSLDTSVAEVQPLVCGHVHISAVDGAAKVVRCEAAPSTPDARYGAVAVAMPGR